MKTLTGYSNRISVRPCESVEFFVSSEDARPYRARLIRLIHGDVNPDGPGYRDEVIPASFEGSYAGMRQQIHAGSFGMVKKCAPASRLESFTVCAIVSPTLPGRGEQVVVAHQRGAYGFELLVDTSGAAAIRVGDGGRITMVSTGVPLAAKLWYLLVATYDATSATVDIRQLALHPQSVASRLHVAAATAHAAFRPAADAALTLAARIGTDGFAEAHFNGKLEAPRLFSRALSHEEADDLAKGTQDHAHPDLVASWDFSVGIDSELLKDMSRNGMDGWTLNLPTRGMTGHSWTGEEMNWVHKPSQYNAIHFHDDDLYNAGWDASFKWQVPEGLKSGIYCAHLSNDDDEEFIPIVVRAPRGKPGARLAFLLPTTSYIAYGNERCAYGPDGALLYQVATMHAHDEFLAAHREYGLSLYDRHSDGSGVAYSSRLRPLLNMRPKVRSWLGGAGSGVWQFNADTHITQFLEAEQIEYDVLSDEDLHTEGIEALEDYACVLTGTHPEYCSTPTLDALESFKGQGGRLVYMGGNGFYSRIAYHPTLPGVIEVRRAEGGIRSWAAAAGEYYHSFTGELGGLWQRLGRPPQTVVGVGMTSQGFDRSTYFCRTPASYDVRTAFAFEGVGEDLIGNFGLVGGGAAGSEIDRADADWGTPGHALVVARSQNHSPAYLMTMEDMYEPGSPIGGPDHPLIHADVTFFETPSGGAVFAMSSIAWAGSLSHDDGRNNVAQITRNVLRRFTDPAQFRTP